MSELVQTQEYFTTESTTDSLAIKDTSSTSSSSSSTSNTSDFSMLQSTQNFTWSDKQQSTSVNCDLLMQGNNSSGQFLNNMDLFPVNKSLIDSNQLQQQGQQRQNSNYNNQIQQKLNRRAITAAHNFPMRNFKQQNVQTNWSSNSQVNANMWNSTSQQHLMVSSGKVRSITKQDLNSNTFQLCKQMSNISLKNEMRQQIQQPTYTSNTNLNVDCRNETFNNHSFQNILVDNQLQDSSKYHLDLTYTDILNNTNMQSLFWNDPQIQSESFKSFPYQMKNDIKELYSRKVFIGGLPPDIDEDEIVNHFTRFGSLVVDWPHKAESKSYFPPKGYAFLIFYHEKSVQDLMSCCVRSDDKFYITVSSPSIKDKAVQIRPWCLIDADYVMDSSQPLDTRRTIFVGGVPRPLKAAELAMILHRLYGGVCYAGIDTDAELKYPKGAGRVAFSNQQSYIAAISARFIQLQNAEIDKRVEVKPYVLDDQICDECQGLRCGGKFAPFFCANVTCLQYYCEFCWTSVHSRPGREFHKPLVKEGADRPRAIPFRWC